MTMSLMSSCTKEARNQVIIEILVPRLISGLTGRAREHLRMAGDLDRFAVDGGLEQLLEYLKTKMGIRRPQEEGMAFKKYINEIKRARGEPMTSWINSASEVY